jgi:hypothetical protein
VKGVAGGLTLRADMPTVNGSCASTVLAEGTLEILNDIDLDSVYENLMAALRARERDIFTHAFNGLRSKLPLTVSSHA